MWLTDNNHNYLRVSRVLRSLTLLGLTEDAKAFFMFLERLSGENLAIDDENVAHWRAALKTR